MYGSGMTNKYTIMLELSGGLNLLKNGEIIIRLPLNEIARENLEFQHSDFPSKEELKNLTIEGLE